MTHFSRGSYNLFPSRLGVWNNSIDSLAHENYLHASNLVRCISKQANLCIHTRRSKSNTYKLQVFNKRFIKKFNKNGLINDISAQFCINNKSVHATCLNSCFTERKFSTVGYQSFWKFWKQKQNSKQDDKLTRRRREREERIKREENKANNTSNAPGEETVPGANQNNHAADTSSETHENVSWRQVEFENGSERREKFEQWDKQSDERNQEREWNQENDKNQQDGSERENENDENESSHNKYQSSGKEERKLRNAFKELLQKRLNNENIYDYDEQKFSHTISMASLPRDLSTFTSREELHAARDVMDLHMKHITKERALNLYYKFYRSSPQFQPSYKTFRYLFYKWRASPITIQCLEADFDALCTREPDDIKGIRSVLNVILLSQRMFGYQADLRSFFARSNGTDMETTVVWDTGKLDEWIPYDGEEVPLREALIAKEWIEDMGGLVYRERLTSEVADWRKFIDRRGGAANLNIERIKKQR